LIFPITFSKVDRVVDFGSEIAPDFAAILGYFGRILGAQKYTTLSKVFQGDKMFLFQKYPKERS
jgi:hypothetical protein